MPYLMAKTTDIYKIPEWLNVSKVLVHATPQNLVGKSKDQSTMRLFIVASLLIKD